MKTYASFKYLYNQLEKSEQIFKDVDTERVRGFLLITDTM